MPVLLADPPSPSEAHARLAQAWPTTFLLESRDGPARLARYSVLGFDPVGTVRLGREGLVVTGALPAPASDQPPLDYLRRVQRFYATEDRSIPFVGGLVGSVGYDFARTVEPTLGHEADEGWPRFLVGLYLDGIVYDHQAGTATYVSRGEDRSARLLEVLQDPAEPVPLRVGRLRSTVDRKTFVSRVERAQRLIGAGEAFQIVLSRAFVGAYEGSLLPLYAWLRDQAPVPYLYHLRFPDRELLGASPEGLVRVRGGEAEAFPIAGTRPITGDGRADAAQGESLRRDTKETAEHAMLVDLARNDLSRVCQAGSVEVAAYQELHAFRDVQHLVSHVRGRLEPGHDAWSALAAVFPAGTVSGAPKVRAMEHIDALEGVPRGPYAGAVCYASFNGDFDSAITIRSLSSIDGRLTVQAGAGIVHRSQPEMEWQETAHKARTLLAGLAAFGADLADENAPIRDDRNAADPPDTSGSPRAAPPMDASFRARTLLQPATVTRSAGATGPAHARPLVLVIDNYDSFTYNLAHGLAAAGADVKVLRNDAVDREGVAALAPAGIVLSPGPGSPAVPRDIGVCAQLVRTPLDVPMLGVCLGMQAMAHILGGRVAPAPEVVHGEDRQIDLQPHALFEGLPRSVRVGRYHSLCVERAPPTWRELARGDGILMAMAHPREPWIGVQFHPESILTPHGMRMLENFVEMCR